MSYNPINVNLTTFKLIKRNYVDWKRHLSIALTSNELTCVIQDFAPSTPNEHSMQEERDTYHNWHKVH